MRSATGTGEGALIRTLARFVRAARVCHDVRMKRAHTSVVARRRATNLSLDEGLVEEARALELNLSRIVEDRLREVVQAERARRWLEENRAGFAAFERFVEKNGIFNEDDREW